MRRLTLAALMACATPVTRWDAAHLIAESHCERERPAEPDCPALIVQGWCLDAADCAETVDEDLLDRCIAELTSECWWLFRDDEDR